MDQNIDAQPDNQINFTADIVAAYVSNNSLPIAGLSELISSVHAALTGLGTPTDPTEAAVEKPTAAQIKNSISDEALISFVDGKSYKTLRRHLSSNGLDFHAYRQRYGLPADYPSTAPGYSARRSELARALGLGQHRNTVGRAGKKEPETGQATSEKAKGRGRPRKDTKL